MRNELEHATKVVGVKQVRRALADGRARRVYLAKDADPQFTQSLAELARDRGVEAIWAESMRGLGRACGIAVGAAVAAELKA